MSHVILDSELIVNADGSIYHLNLLPEDIADTVIIVGDPGRVSKVSKYFSNIEVQKQKREMTTHTGYYNDKRLTVMSTGMGTDNIDIVLNELDALVNIDLKQRQIKPSLTKLRVVRLGTSGALQADIPLDSFVVSTHGVGLDVLLHYYVRELSIEEQLLTDAFIQHLGDYAALVHPYIAEGSAELVNLFNDVCIEGMTATASGFYAPQGRVLRYELAMPKLIDMLPTFVHGARRITNFEMETSAIYGLGHRLLGHECCSVNLIVANRQTKKFSTHADASMEKMIQMALEKLTK